MATFTKEKLKSELEKYDIPFPKDAKKEVYLELYQNHVENKGRLEFSSDEEGHHLLEAAINSSPSKRSKAKKPVKKPSKEAMQQLIPSELSDDDLREALKDRGYTPGPITDETRFLYVRKLEKLLSAKNPSEPVTTVTTNHTSAVVQTTIQEVPKTVHVVSKSVPIPAKLAPIAPKSVPIPPTTVHVVPPPQLIRETEFSDPDVSEFRESIPSPDFDIEPEPEPKLSVRKRPVSAAVRQSPRKAVKKPEPAPQITRHYEEQDSGEEEDVPDVPRPSRLFTNGPPSSPQTMPSLPTQTPSDKHRSRFPIWLQVVILLVVCAVVYFIIQNLEPSGRSYVGKLSPTPTGA